MLADKRRQFADRFDQIHSIEQAVRTGSVKAIVELPSLRGSLISAVERGIHREDDTILVHAHATVPGP